MPIKFLQFWIFLVLLFVTPTGLVWAQTEEENFCEEILNTAGGLNIDQIQEWMGNGADWAIKNLKTEQLASIKKYIVYEENLKFRCRDYVPIPMRNPVERPVSQLTQATKGRSVERRIPLPPRKPI